MLAQLWLVEGRHPVVWNVPFWVVFDGDKITCKMAYAVGLTCKQQAAVKPHMDRLATPVSDGIWGSSLGAIEQFALKLPTGVEPEDFFAWERKREVIQPMTRAGHPRDQGNERDEFIDAMYLSGWGESREEVAVWWNQFCKHSLNWLLVRNKPVDMFFVRLQPSPYRPNWKLAIFSRFPWLGRLICRAGKNERDYHLHRSGFYEEALNLDLLAMDKRRGFCYRYVDVEHRPTWFKNVRKVEAERLSQLGPVKYASATLAAIKHSLGTTLRLYVEFLNNMALPSAAACENAATGDYRLVPHIYRGAHSRRWDNNDPVPVVVPNRLPDFTESSVPSYLLGATETGVRPVPVVQQEAPDMRNGGGNLHTQGQLPLTPSGMLVLHAIESSTESKLLGLRSGVDAGLAAAAK